MMMRGNFETSVYKPMKIPEFDRANLRRPATAAIAVQPPGIAWHRPPDKAARIAATLLGAAGAAAMSLLLSLLFSFG
jgi:hypothetical protein